MTQLISNMLMQPKPDAVIQRPEPKTLIEKLENYRDTQTDYEATLADAVIDSCVDIVKQHSEWISVDERLPNENGFYLVQYMQGFHDGSYFKRYDVVEFCKPIKKFNFYHDRITHWQLIQPPSEVKNDG